jgi:hypothetical protein
LPSSLVVPVVGASPEGDRRLANLLARDGAPAGWTLPVTTPVSYFGLSSGLDAVLPDPHPAARRAELRLRSGLWSLTDLGVPGGLLVDGQPVRDQVWLAPGSSVRVGSVELVFVPADEWSDSPHDRVRADRAPLLVVPESNRAWWPTLGFLLALGAVMAAFFYFLRHA